ncbi:MAG: hypothetical protein A2821_00495 [Candidatus Magasanikbacteria bacterium RIFCSPHIGHO2_01_FULL_41_23]|uniref:Glycosyltransferase 2-like domain-containing protein n=1 Tax=Candidatus Magasanikbacteria bacterium RIFCSPLOWO2_01_FULL_40_15 TaxID=1798686 RepID=A0A1F6N0X5_9BACT|nr:MAG: hypothetical protein A2821_00495 [Candidatus Magasanikbacteria bacterium RIFCSPHIGHO2_01_FULL_41_23]OGH74657.1 MAG: hypothetical protein A3F22_01850 [Candidatus Magasanikbacteria bacterium RIFCSPHIGHO2_12_FULL_41_16]OGH77370.1 MAG: hypothetical protein A2983_01550 [Candidatus Magasanikbacteria bacterium RIFCSPLOWO2_01_FULL_40_15]
MNLSIITVTWNSIKNIDDQIQSVNAAVADLDYEHIIIDNGSTDGTVELLQSKYNENDLQLCIIENKENVGFSAANNEGVAMAKGDYLLFLNPDMRLEPASLRSLLEWMKDKPQVGIVSPKLTNEKGQYNQATGPRRFPTLVDQLAVMLKIPHLSPKILDHYLMADFNPEKEQLVDSVQGSFMLMRREIVEKLGWAFDPRYFIWFEDVDICREVKRLGYEVMYTPIISAVDYVGQSFKKRTTLWKQKQFSASMLIYFKKWEPWYIWIWIALVRPFGIALIWLAEKVRRKYIV